MQSPFSCTPTTFQGVQASLSLPRIGRYLPAAGNDKHFALRLYVWNARLCEAFYLPMQFAEVALRNAIHQRLLDRYGPGWENNSKFLDTLSLAVKGNLQGVIADQRINIGVHYTIDDVIAALPLGFWDQLLTKNFYHTLWKDGIESVFPNAPENSSAAELHTKVNRFRIWRNKIAHHYAIFDLQPNREYRNILELISWASADLFWLATRVSTLSRVINARPKL